MRIAIISAAAFLVIAISGTATMNITISLSLIIAITGAAGMLRAKFISTIVAIPCPAAMLFTIPVGAFIAISEHAGMADAILIRTIITTAEDFAAFAAFERVPVLEQHLTRPRTLCKIYNPLRPRDRISCKTSDSL